MYNVVLCDDDNNYIDYMQHLLEQCGLTEDNSVFYAYPSGEEFIQALPHLEKIDLLILDIQMTGINGHETAALFRKKYSNSVLVFCSGVIGPTVEAFETLPYRYLLKEYTKDNMLIKLREIVEHVKHIKSKPVILGEYRGNIRVNRLDEILYIEKVKNGRKIHLIPDIITKDYEAKLLCKDSLQDIYEKLCEFGFEYAHNSYIVNMDYIKCLTGKDLTLVSGEVLSVSRTRIKKLRYEFARYKSSKY